MPGIRRFYATFFLPAVQREYKRAKLVIPEIAIEFFLQAASLPHELIGKFR